MHWAIPENIQTGVLRTWFFEKDPWNFRYVILPLEISDKRQNKASPLEILQNRVTSIGISGQKPRPMETLHNFFWITFRNSTSFFYWPWNFHNLFLIILEIPCPLRILSYQTKRDKAIIRIDKTQNLFETMRVWVIKCEFLNEISGMSSTRAEFNFLSIQVIESQLCLWISIIFSSNFT